MQYINNTKVTLVTTDPCVIYLSLLCLLVILMSSVLNSDILTMCVLFSKQRACLFLLCCYLICNILPFSSFYVSVGETGAGKAARSLAQHIPGPGGIEGMKGAASGIVGDLARARIALDERGQKLGEVEERTAAMMASADSFSKHAHEVQRSHR